MGQNQRIVRFLIWVVFLFYVFKVAREMEHHATIAVGKKPVSQSPPASDAPIIKVTVFADGHITADGAPATVDSLREPLKKLAEQNGVVWYYQELGQGRPTPQFIQVTMQVIKVVTEARLPIRISSRPDYSDAIGLNGKLIQQSHTTSN
jgi:hypothetical protein